MEKQKKLFWVVEIYCIDIEAIKKENYMRRDVTNGSVTSLL